MPRDLSLLPKAHLHLHFTGSMDPATLLELVEAQGLTDSARLIAIAQGTTPMRWEPSRRGWFRFQRMYDAARRVVRSEAVMRRLILEAAQADAAEGSARLELQVDPTSYAPFVGGLTPALEIILDAAKSAWASTGVEVAIIVACSRMKHPLDARTLARLAVRHGGDGPGEVVGFGLSNDERHGTTADFAPAFQIAARGGLALVPHGGELLGPDHVREVVTHLHPNRLGHGVRASEDPQLLARLIDDGVAFEVCPQSNVSLGVYETIEKVPLATLVDAGAQIALGADDPLLFGSRLVDQYQAAREAHGFSDRQLADLAKSSIRASLASETTKRKVEARIDAWLAA